MQKLTEYIEKRKFFKKYKESVIKKEPDYSLIDYSVPRPKKEDYSDWDTWFQDHCKFLKLKYQYTYGK